MADLKISALTGASTPLAGTEVLPIVQSSTTKKVSVANLTAGRAVAMQSATITGAGTTSATFTIQAQNATLTSTFSVRDDGYFQTGAAANSPYNATTGSAANVFILSDGALYRSTSSLKYKKNVQDTAHGLVDLLKLRAVTYEGKSIADSGKTFGGLIAEEVHEAGLTEFVQYAEDGTPDALAYGNMVSLCIKAIQEQQAMIESQQAMIEALQTK